MEDPHAQRETLSLHPGSVKVGYLSGVIQVFEAGQPFAPDLPRGCRVAVKPNLTFPTHRPGVTTTPAVLRAGASSVAVISDLLSTGDPARRVREYLKALGPV